jgi:hypothetical protein
MAGSGYLEKDLLLALEHDLPIVQPPGEVHQPIGFEELLVGEAVLGLGIRGGAEFGICFRGRHPVPYPHELEKPDRFYMSL